jgi:hypothetical protein
MMRKTNLWTLLMALVMLFSMAACGEKGDDVTNEAEGPKPPTTVDDNDWQTVASSGGTIEKDSISITFPSGTFSGDTKVAISNVSKGKIYGDLEVSPFYQITMPITTKKATTIKIKSQKLDDDVSFIFHSTSFSRHGGTYSDSDIILESSYSNGEYSVTLPVFDNDDETNTSYFAIGLARTITSDDITRSSKPVEKGTVNGVKWELYIDPSAKAYNFYNEVVNVRELPKIRKYIEDAITKITDLGFKLAYSDRVIYYYIRSKDESWGEFKQSFWADSYSYIDISVEHLFYAKQDKDEFSMPCTVLHETFHYFQSNYDPRSAKDKAGGYPAGAAVDNENIIYEMGAIWIEQYANNGQLNANYLKEIVFKKAFYQGDKSDGKGDKLGFGLELERWGGGSAGWQNKNVIASNQQQGYTMGPLIYYITTMMKDYGFRNKSILELYELFNKNWKSGTHNTYYILNDWLTMPTHNAGYLLENSNFDDYWLELWQGKLVKDFSLTSIFSNNNNFKIEDKNGKYVFGDDLYQFGCGVRKVALTGFKDTPLDDKELVIKQENTSVHSYVVIASKKSNYKTFLPVTKGGEIRCINQGDSIVIKGSTLETLREDDGTIQTHFYIISTNWFNTLHNTAIYPYKVSIELRDKEEDVNNVTPFRTNFSLGVKYFEEVTRDGNTTTSETYNEELPFGFANINGYDKEITTTVDGTTLKVSCVNEERGMKETLSYDILNFNGNNMKVANLVYTLHSEGEHYVSGDGNVDVVRDYTIKIYGQLSFTRSNPGGGMQEYDFGLSETINSANIYFEDKRINKRKWSEEMTSTVEWKLVPNTTFNAYLSFEFYP